ncbi:MAG: TPM domain-containing protein [Pseudoxanthomonas suwonensis]|nr:TPM domain-containing protein [Pseudoxanthomonas suwonensis]
MRVFRHLFAPSAQRLFPVDSLQRIAAAIADSETRHCGEICFAVESALPMSAVLRGCDPRSRALDAFAQLRVWDTQANNGVLIYLLLADRDIEIVADRGLDGRIVPAQWEEACALIERRMREGQPEQAVLAGVAAVGALLAEHDPRTDGSTPRNELPDLPRILR